MAPAPGLSLYAQKWERRFNDLSDYKKKEGHCNVPKRYPDNRQLATWVDTQRTCRKEEKLSKDRIARLAELGFKWSLIEDWKQRFSELSKYQQENGHCNVPSKFQDNPQLGIWVNTQRRRHKVGKLSRERRARLVDLGFSWEVMRRREPSPAQVVSEDEGCTFGRKGIVSRSAAGKKKSVSRGRIPTTTKKTSAKAASARQVTLRMPRGSKKHQCDSDSASSSSGDESDDTSPDPEELSPYEQRLARGLLATRRASSRSGLGISPRKHRDRPRRNQTSRALQESRPVRHARTVVCYKELGEDDALAESALAEDLPDNESEYEPSNDEPSPHISTPASKRKMHDNANTPSAIDDDVLDAASGKERATTNIPRSRSTKGEKQKETTRRGVATQKQASPTAAVHGDSKPDARRKKSSGNACSSASSTGFSPPKKQAAKKNQEVRSRDKTSLNVEKRAARKSLPSRSTNGGKKGTKWRAVETEKQSVTTAEVHTASESGTRRRTRRSAPSLSASPIEAHLPQTSGKKRAAPTNYLGPNTRRIKKKELNRKAIATGARSIPIAEVNAAGKSVAERRITRSTSSRLASLTKSDFLKKAATKATEKDQATDLSKNGSAVGREESMQQQLTEARARISELSEEKAKLTTEIARQTAENMRLRQETTARVSNLSDEKAQLTAENARQARCRRDMTARMLELREDVAKLTAEVRRQEAEASRWRETSAQWSEEGITPFLATDWLQRS